MKRIENESFHFKLEEDEIIEGNEILIGKKLFWFSELKVSFSATKSLVDSENFFNEKLINRKIQINLLEKNIFEFNVYNENDKLNYISKAMLIGKAEIDSPNTEGARGN